MITLAEQLRHLAREINLVADALAKQTRASDPLGPWTIEWVNGCAVNGRRRVVLTRSEAAILRVLIDNRGTIVRRDHLFSALYGGAEGVDSRSVDIHVANVRRKLGDPDLIVTAHSRGYRVS